MQTNGYSVEYTFKQKPIKNSTSKPLTAADFCEDTKNNHVLIWGVDRGVTDIYTAADSGDASKKERIRRTSSKEYYLMCGFNLARQKTSNLINFVNAAAQRLISLKV
ncbi:hypothetical protein [Parasitella parasitica]|uniref:Uncharacterized protein n=1 Tax=Parasitella parasitica TaxID=35722 RepID=A0A0B7ND26_9FUNG|nr:hypothetical protein [Parasitella parasitica]